MVLRTRPRPFDLPWERERDGGEVRGPRGPEERGSRVMETAGDRHPRGRRCLRWARQGHRLPPDDSTPTPQNDHVDIFVCI